jgi:hypothetical protein
MPSLIPPEILALLETLPLLKGESRQNYMDFLTRVASDIRPADLMEWLWTIRFADNMWEIFRNRGFRVKLIDLQNDQATRSVILKTTPYNSMRPNDLEQAFARWKADPSEFSKHGIDPQSVPAMALVQVSRNLEAIDKISGRLEKSNDTILQQLEGRREMFATRARRTANNMLNESIPLIAASEAPLAAELEDQTTSDEAPTNEVTIVPPPSPEASVPNADEPSPESSETKSSADSQS